MLAVAIMLLGMNSFAEESTTQKPAMKPAPTFEKTLQNYQNAPKNVKKDLDKASQERQKQLDDAEKKLEGN
jgi:Skp family chaperone for outer membrane proteins